MVYIVLTLFLVVLLSPHPSNLGLEQLLLVGLLLGLSNIAFFIWVFWSIDDYALNVKDKIFPIVVSFFGDFKFNRETSKSVDEYDATEIIPKHHRENAEDHITGTYKDVGIDLFETELEEQIEKQI